MTLYFAYGANLSLAAMERRAPGATPIGKFTLLDSRLVFRGVADCAYEPGAKCYGGLWRITPRCEDALDKFEGIKSGFYRKEYVDLEPGKFREDRLMFYTMNSTGVFPPDRHYLDTIRQGYRDFKLPMQALTDALKWTWDNKNPSRYELERHERKNRPALARPISPVPERDRNYLSFEERMERATGQSPTGNYGDLFEDAQ